MIICCGEALIDMIPETSPDGTSIFRPCPGGSPYNSVIAIGRLGVSTAFLGRISNDFFGEMLVERLRSNNVSTHLIKRTDQNTSLAFVKLETGKEPQYIFYTENSADRSLSPEDLPKNIPEDLHGILFGSIAMNMEPIASTIEQFIREQSKRKDKTAPILSFDPNVRPIVINDKQRYLQRLEKIFKIVDIVKISAADMEFLYPDLSHQQALEKIISFGARIVVTTLGSDGAVAVGLRDNGSRFKASAPVIPVKVVDTIGAGDTFHAALLSWLELHNKLSCTALEAISEEELTEALVFANKAAAYVCSRQGAEPPILDTQNGDFS